MKIVILGGGTAGWLTACLVSGRHPLHDITVIESSKIGIVGVGESTTGFFTELLLNELNTYFGITHDEFIVETGATLKFGIKHMAWTPDINSQYYGVLEGSVTYQGSPDAMFGYNYLQSHADTISTTHTGFLLANNKSNLGPDFKFKKHGHALHIDAGLTGKYLAKKCLAKGRVKHIDAEVLNAVLDNQGNIDRLNLTNGEVINGDLFIDCSGMSRVLINQLDSKWVSYKDNLPVDTAIAFPETYQDGELLEPCTTAWAQSSGWIWQTPLMDRRGNGYVFSSAFTSVDKAHAEIESVLGRKINPAKVITFDAGRKPNAWVKNCIAIGLSNAFLEPLEATSIHTTIVQIKTLVTEFLKPTIQDTLNPASIKMFNQRMARHFDDVRDFLVMHYMGGRQDSEFWRYISSGATKTDFVQDLIDTSRSRLPSYNDFPKYYGASGWDLYCYVMSGIGILNKQAVSREFDANLLSQAQLNTHMISRHIEAEYTNYKSYSEFIEHYRKLRAK